jgi:glycosyltransferase involved in cell wall biosynthesis
MKKTAILCVANWDSNVGYAWWLMESFWIKVCDHYDCKYNVVLAYPSISKIPERIDMSNLDVVKMDFTFEKYSSIFYQLKFIFINGIKYIYFSDRPTYSWRYPLYRLMGVKVILVHDHTPGLRCKPGKVKHFLKCLLARIPFINVNGVIGATNYVKKRLIEVNCIPKEKCYSAPNGLPDIESSDMVEVDPYKLFNIPKNRKIIVSTGRANLYKGVDFALKTIRCLLDQYVNKNIHFLFIGDGPHLVLLNEMALDLNVLEYVTFAGRINNVTSILPKCYVAFHPSKGEVGYSLSILEYMRAGLAVVVSDNLSVCEATDNNVTGYIYKQFDELDAAKKLELLLNSSELCRSMGDKARTKISECYSLENCHDSLIDAIDSQINMSVDV